MSPLHPVWQVHSTPAHTRGVVELVEQAAPVGQQFWPAPPHWHVPEMQLTPLVHVCALPQHASPGLPHSQVPLTQVR
jgi:hypothetical protein